MLEWKEGSLLHNYSKIVCGKNIKNVQFILYDFKDLMQECYIVYHKCKEKYSDFDDKHFFVVFRKSLANLFINLSLRNNKQERVVSYINSFSPILEEANEHSMLQAEFNISISSLPDNIKEFISDFYENPHEGMTKVKCRHGLRNVDLKEYFCNYFKP